MSAADECGWCGHTRANHSRISSVCLVDSCQCYEWHEPRPKADLRSVMPHQEVYNKEDVVKLALLADNLLCNPHTFTLASTKMRLDEIDDDLINRMLHPEE